MPDVENVPGDPPRLVPGQASRGRVDFPHTPELNIGRIASHGEPAIVGTHDQPMDATLMSRELDGLNRLVAMAIGAEKRRIEAGDENPLAIGGRNDSVDPL